MVNQFLKVIEESDDDLKETLIELYKVYCLTLIKENIGFFIKENLINKKSYEKVNEELNLNNKLLAQKSLDLVKSFNIPDWMHHAPIANDWEEYNRTENNGELENQSYKI